MPDNQGLPCVYRLDEQVVALEEQTAERLSELDAEQEKMDEKMAAIEAERQSKLTRNVCIPAPD